MRLRQLPFNLIRSVYRGLRKAVFTKPRPDGEYLVVTKRVPYIERLLGQHSYAPNWELSYNYRGEDLNLARVTYDRIEGSDVWWWQTHVRGWERSGRVWLHAHYEPEPVENPKAHLKGVSHDMNGNEQLERVLDDVGLEYERLTWDDG